MCTTRAPLALIAVAALGLVGWMAPSQARPDGSPPPDSSGERPTKVAKQPEYVLLTDGRLVQGVVTEEDGLIIVTQPIGAMRYPKKRVEQVFPDVRSVYEYKLEQLPENDSHERIKLAQWCLNQDLEPEAKLQLEAILDRSPKHTQAKAMMAAINQAHERRAIRRQDPEVQQAGGEKVQTPGNERPGLLDAAILSGARRGMGLTDMPVIFELPQAQAVRRADEFARYVHPVIQAYCARCHNDQYEGTFQLISFKTKLNRTPDALKSNLDACLKLIDREYPVRSELLASSLRPHGRGPTKRPIFQGSNDRAYQVLATWVNKLQSTRTPEATNRPRPTARDEFGDRFGSDRGRVQSDADGLTPVTQRFVTGPVETKVIPPARFEPGKGMIPDTSTDPDEFPLPLAAGGKGPGIGTQPQAGSKAATLPAPKSDASRSDPALRPATAEEDPPLPDMAGANARTASPPDSDDTKSAPGSDPKKPRKPLKLDPKLLQRALELKNQSR